MHDYIFNLNGIGYPILSYLTENRMSRLFSLLICLLLSNTLLANKIVNVYAWGGEIPKKVIQAFERESGITVNFSTYDSNETMYAKLRSSKQSIYDVVLPSAYFVERMKKQGMLTKLDHNKLPNLKNIDPHFIENDYDKGNHYSVPLIWGATGIFYNQRWVKNAPQTWQSLWDKSWRLQLMLLDDPREVFALALMSLHYSPNDNNPKHIQAAYEKLLTLIPNIKLFGSDGIQAAIIDEDAILGSAWNGDVFKAIVNLRATRNDLQIMVLNTDHGIGIIRRGAAESNLPLTIEQVDNLGYGEFDKHRVEYLNLKQVDYYPTFIKDFESR